MFTNSQNTSITGGNFVLVSDLGGTTGKLDLLRHNSAPGALLDSNERFDAPKCSEETRLAVIQKVLEWIDNDEESASMMWLYGAVGAGKSALGQTIAELLKKKGQLAGCFFFSRTSTSQRRDGNRLIPTLVLQLLESFPLIRPQVEENIKKHQHLFHRSRRTQMDVLFIQPLLSLESLRESHGQNHWLSTFLPNNFTGYLKPEIGQSPIPKVPQLILIDGLDECEDVKVQVDLLQIIADAIPKLPFPLRILIASRPEAHITRSFDHDLSFQQLRVQRINLGADPHANVDIQKFLELGFAEIRRIHPLRAHLDNWPPERAIATLVQKSSGHFIYASTAMKYIQYWRGRPDERLKIILNLSLPPITDKPFAELDALYTYIFDCVSESDRYIIKCALGIVYIAGHGERQYKIGTSPAKLEKYLDLQSGDLALLFEPLLSLVAFSHIPNAKIKIMHASLFDYLLDPSRSINHFLRIDFAHEKLAMHWLKVTQTFTHNNVQTKPEFDFAYMRCCWFFLCHCYFSHLSSDLQNYLSVFEFLYDVILHPTLLPKAAATRDNHDNYHPGLDYIPDILQIFFTLLLREGFNNGQHWHRLHTTRIEQRLRSLYGGRDARLLDNLSQDPLFNDGLYQSRHQVYMALSNFFLVHSNTTNLLEILHLRSSDVEGTGQSEVNANTHFLVAFLSHLSIGAFELCKDYRKYTILSSKNAPTNELGLVLRQKVGAYLQRVEADVEPAAVRGFKNIWGIE